MIDCLLVFPIPSKDSPNHNVALGMLFVGATLERQGYSVRYVDLRFDSWDQMIGIVKDGVRVVGISTMTGNQCVQAATILSAVKALQPRVLTVLGGVHPTMLPRETLSSEPDLDCIVLGEGESTMPDVVRAARDGSTDFKGVAGVAWKSGGEVVINPGRPFLDLGETEFPLTTQTRRFFEIAARTNNLSYYTTRGCPFRCSFCYNLVFNDRKWRQLPLDVLYEHLSLLRREFDAKHVYLVDDYLGHGAKRLTAVSETIARTGLAWRSSIRVSDITPEIANVLDSHGCDSLLLGVESASPSVQQGVLVKDYKHGADDVRSCVNSLRATRIRPLYSFMYNVPGETTDDLEASFELAEWIYKTDKRAMIGFYAYTPYPGTPLYHQALANGFKPPVRLAEWGEYSLSNELNPKLRDLYFIAGLRFRGRSGDRTDQNFGGLSRLKIAPFELLSRVRWATRRFCYSDFERNSVRSMIERASRASSERRLNS